MQLTSSRICCRTRVINFESSSTVTRLSFDGVLFTRNRGCHHPIFNFSIEFNRIHKNVPYARKHLANYFN